MNKSWYTRTNILNSMVNFNVKSHRYMKIRGKINCTMYLVQMKGTIYFSRIKIWLQLVQVVCEALWRTTHSEFLTIANACHILLSAKPFIHVLTKKTFVTGSFSDLFTTGTVYRNVYLRSSLWGRVYLFNRKIWLCPKNVSFSKIF